MSKTVNPLMDLLDVIYPVGAVYISTSAVDPALLFGGRWKRIEDRFLLAAGAHQAGAVGGAESIATGASSAANTGSTTVSVASSGGSTTGGTAITVAQMPSHKHQGFSREYSDGGQTYPNGIAMDLSWMANGTFRGWYVDLTSAGGGQAHTHSTPNHVHTLTNGAHTHTMAHTHSVSTMPPYLAVYIWERTA